MKSLVVIDMQKVFEEPGSPWFTPGFADVVAPIQNLVEAFQPRVTFTRFIAPAVPAGAWRKYYERWPFALQPADAEIYDLIDDFAGPSVDATTFGKWGPELADKVGDTTMVLSGVSTDCCVLSTALAAADAGVEVQVVGDACAGGEPRANACGAAVVQPADRSRDPEGSPPGSRDPLGEHPQHDDGEQGDRGGEHVHPGALGAGEGGGDAVHGGVPTGEVDAFPGESVLIKPSVSFSLAMCPISHLGEDLVDLAGQRGVLRREAAVRVRAQPEGQRPPADVDIRMVVDALGDLGDAVHHRDRAREAV
jgi:nicotinamidase-related amidase